MTDFDDIERVPHTFRGSLAFNQRTVGSAITTLLGQDPSGRFLAGTPLQLPELVNVLLVLESVAMSNGMYLDGTLPPGDIDRLEASFGRVKLQSGVDLGIGFLRPKPDVLLSLFQDAAETGALLIDDGLTRLHEQTDDPMTGDITKFVHTIRAATEDASGRAGMQFAEETALAAAEGRETFRGSKCVAGIVAAAREPVPLLERAAAHLLSTTENIQRKVIAVLINRFRINYVNSLATLQDAAYLADVTIEDLRSTQVILFSQYLADRISRIHAEELTAHTQQLFDQSLRAVPLGFAILMNSEARLPIELVAEAMRLRDRAFCRAAAGETPQARFLHQMTADEFADFKDYLFEKAWTHVVNDAERPEPSSRWRQIRLPALAGGVIGAILGSLAGGPVGAAAGAAAGGAIQFAGEDIVARTLRSGRVLTDQYRKLDQYIAGAVKKDRRLKAFSQKVESVFGRSLELA